MAPLLGRRGVQLGGVEGEHVHGYRKLPRIVIMVAALGAGVVGQAHAQARQAVSISGGPAWKDASAPAVRQSDGLTEEERDPMGSAAIGIKVGAAGTGVAKLSSDRQDSSFPGAINGRRGLRIAFPIHLGGSGFGWTFEPYLSQSRLERLVKTASGKSDGTRVYDVTAFGVYTGPSVQLHVTAPFYLGLGFGVMSSYLASAGFAYGADIYGRVPLSLTYYVSSQLALVAELGLGYGVSLFANKPRAVVDSNTRAATKVIDPGELGQTLAWDFTLGVRLP